MMILLLIISLMMLLYLLGMLAMIIGWHQSSISNNEGKELKLSVVIAIRNEADQIEALLSDLNLQTLNKNNYEVILVNDHSYDSTVEKVEAFQQRHPEMNLNLLHSEDEGKKSAIKLGIDFASSEHIITTDGDCRVGENWLRCFQRELSLPTIKMVCGPVSYAEKNSIFSRLQSLEFAGLIGLGAAGLKLNYPNMCNGANLGFLKSAFYDVKGYEGNETIASGDDEFLMHKIYRQDPASIKFLKDADSIVTTEPHASVKDFVQQRKRWASKWEHYQLSGPRFMAVFVFGFYLSILIALLLSFAGLYPWKILLLQIIVKIGIDFFFLSGMMRFLKKRLHPLIFLLMELIYPLYVVIFGVLSNVGSYEWKGRKF